MKKPEKRNDEIELAAPRSTPEPLTVAEIKADPDFIFEPWFRSRRVSYQIRTFKSVPEREAWSEVFKKHGCIICRTKQKSHASLGMCSTCHQRIGRWLDAAIRLRADGAPQTFTFDNEEVARKALAEACHALLAAATEDQYGKS